MVTSDLDKPDPSQNRPKEIYYAPVVVKTESESIVITDAGNVVAIGVATGESCCRSGEEDDCRNQWCTLMWGYDSGEAANRPKPRSAMADSSEKQCAAETPRKMMFENQGVLSSDRPTIVVPIAAKATTTTVSYVPAGMTRVVQQPQQQQMLLPVWTPSAAEMDMGWVGLG